MNKIGRNLLFLGLIIAGGLILAGCETIGRYPPVMADYYTPTSDERIIHAAADFPEMLGRPVAASADGTVIPRKLHWTCGNGIVIKHDPFELYTRICHARPAWIDPYRKVKRGEIIAYVDGSGRHAPDRPHVEMALCRVLRCWHPGYADPPEKLDPLVTKETEVKLDNNQTVRYYYDGYYDPERAKTYPKDVLVLTSPVLK